MEPIVLEGKYSSAKIFTNKIEETAETQIQNLLDHPMSKDAHIRIMPDVHAGMGCVIGFTAKLTDFVVPSLIGVDIGCGVLAQRINFRLTDDKERREFFEDVDKWIHEAVPSGFQCHEAPIQIQELRSEFE